MEIINKFVLKVRLIFTLRFWNEAVNVLVDHLLPKPLSEARRRKRYDEIRSIVLDMHFSGHGGMKVPFKYDSKDLQSFTAPMYWHARTEKNERCIFWRKDLMDEEVGPPLKIEETSPRQLVGFPNGYQDDRF